jgi:hypothetical protein
MKKKKLIWVEFLIRGYVNTKSLRSPDVGLTSFAVKRELPRSVLPQSIGLILFGRNMFSEVIKHSSRDLDCLEGLKWGLIKNRFKMIKQG